MKAAIVTAQGKTPIYGDIQEPTAKPGEEIISVRAAALSTLTRSRASGAHYSSAGIFPAVAGTDGVGITPDGRRVYFAMPEAPNGSLAEYCPIHPRRCVAIPDCLDDITAAAIANPGLFRNIRSEYRNSSQKRPKAALRLPNGILRPECSTGQHRETVRGSRPIA